MDELLRQIRELPDDQAMEAARLLASGDVAPGRTETIIGRVAAEAGTIEEADLHNALRQISPTQAAELARALLAYAALSGRDEDVRLAIAGTGQRLVILEALAIGALALAAFQLYQTGGVKSTTETTDVTVAPDGTIKIRREKIVDNYAIGDILGGILKHVLAGSGTQP